jgi:mRNA interferase RelE/StbE
MEYSVSYSETSRQQIKGLHPQARAIVKAQIEVLRTAPFSGKALEKELSGYYSLRTRRLRIIYQVENNSHSVQIYYVGHRRDIYELFKEALKGPKEFKPPRRPRVEDESDLRDIREARNEPLYDQKEAEEYIFMNPVKRERMERGWTQEELRYQAPKGEDIRFFQLRKGLRS